MIHARVIRFKTFCFVLLRNWACLIGLVALALVPHTAYGQCTHFLNATDGSDTNPGTQVAPLRSFEFAFSTLASGSVVCMAAGEYHFGDDADGIQLVAANKSMTFVLESFAFNTEVRFSEDVFLVDLGNGTLTFRSGSINALAFGPGVLNNDASFGDADDLNFLHSLILASGTVDISDVETTIGASVGNPSFVNPDNTDKVAPSDARLERGNGQLIGSPVFSNVPRLLRYSGTLDQSTGPELPPPGANLTFQLAHRATLTFPTQVSLSTLAADTPALRIEPTHSGTATFTQALTLTSRLGQQASLIHHQGSGVLTIPELRVDDSSSASVTLQHSGTGDLLIGSLLSTNGDQASVIHLSNERGTVRLGNPTTTFDLTGQLSNAANGTIELAGSLQLATTISSGAALLNAGTLSLSTHALLLTNAATTYQNDGPILAEPGGAISLTGDINIDGQGPLPSVTILSGTARLGAAAIDGDLNLSANSSLLLAADRPVRINGVLNMNSTGTLSQTSSTPVTVAEAAILARGQLNAAHDWLFERSVTQQPSHTLNLGSHTLRIHGDTRLEGPVSDAGGTILLAGSNPQVFVVTTQLRGNALHLQGSDIQIDSAQVLAAPVRIASGSTTVRSPLTLTNDLQLSGGQLAVTDSLTLLADFLQTGGSLQAEQATLRFAGAQNQRIANETPLILGTLTLDQANTHLTLTNTLTTHHLVLTDGILTISPQHPLNLTGTLTQTGGVITDTQGAIHFTGTAPQQLLGVRRLPATVVQAEALTINEPLTIAGDFELAAGRLAVTDTLTLLADFSQTGGSLQAEQATLHFAGAQNQRLQVPTPLVLHTLHVDEANTNLRLTVPSLILNASLHVRPATVVHLDSTIVRMQGATRQPVLHNEGTFTTTHGGQVLFFGPLEPSAFFQLRGSGLYGNMEIRLRDDSEAVALDTATEHITLSGTLAFTVGNLDLNGNRVELSDAIGQPHIRRNMSDAIPTPGQVDGGTFIDAQETGGFNTANRSYDLTYTGALTSSYLVGPEFQATALRTVTLSAVDALNTPPRFGMTLQSDATLSGNLTVADNAVLNLGTHNLTLQNPNASHLVEGQITGTGATHLTGSGTLLGGINPNAEARLGHLIIDSGTAPWRVSDLKHLRRLDIQSGIVSLSLMPRTENLPGQIQTSLTQLGGHVALGSDLSIGTPATPGELALQAGTFNLTPDWNVEVHSGGHISIGSNADDHPVVSVTAVAETAETRDTDEEGGFITLSGSGTLEAASLIPRLRLDPRGALDDVTLTNHAGVSEIFEVGQGDLFLGDYTFEHAGTQWQVASPQEQAESITYRIRGTLGTPSGLFRITGPVLTEWEGDVGFFSTHVEIGLQDENQTLRLQSMPVTEPRTVSLFDTPLTLSSGTLDLGIHDIILDGNAPNLFSYHGGQITAASQPAFPDLISKTPLDATLYPFVDDAYGELVFRGNGAASAVLTAPIEIPHLRIDASTTVAPTSETVTVTKRFVFGQQNASFQTPRDSLLVLASGSTILRRGFGQLSSQPLFEGSISVAYELDDGDITGHDTQFGPSILVTDKELPAEDKGLLNVLFFLGDGLGIANQLLLEKPLSLTGSLVLYSGEVLTQDHPITLAEGSSFVHYNLDPDAPPVLITNLPYETTGPIDLHFSSLYTDIRTSDLLFPSNLLVRHLHVDVGNPSLPFPQLFALHASRTVETLTIANDANSIFDLAGTTLHIHTDAQLKTGILRNITSSPLHVGGDLDIAEEAAILGPFTVETNGTTHIAGTFSASDLIARGDVIVEGALSSQASISFEGSAQTLHLNSGNLTLRNLRLQQDALPNGDTGSVRLASTSFKPRTLTLQGTLTLAGGLLETFPHTLALTQTTQPFVRPPLADSPSHVIGILSQVAPRGTTAPVIFPVGTSSAYRPVSITFEGAGLPATTRLEVTHRDIAPLGKNGLAIQEGIGPVVRDAANFFWVLRSDLSFDRTVPYTLGFSGEGLAPSDIVTGASMLQRPFGDISARWQFASNAFDYNFADDMPTGTLSSLRQGLTSQGQVYTFGLGTAQTSDLGEVQFIHNATNIDLNTVDVYLNDELAFDDVSFRRASARTQLALPNGTPETFTLSIAPDSSIDRTEAFATTTVTVRPSNPEIVVALDDLSGSLNLLKLPDARLQAQDGGDTDFVLVQGSPDLPLTDVELFSTSTPLQSNMAFGEISAYASLPPSLHSLAYLEPNTTHQLAASTLNFAGLPGRALVALTSGFLNPPGNEASRAFNTIVVTPDGDVRLGEIVTSIERPEVEEQRALPLTFALHGNYPNPFNPTTTITFDLPQAADVHVEIFDLIGRKVLQTPIASLGAGRTHRVQLDAGSLSSGLYLYRLIAETLTQTFTETGNMILLK